MSELPYEAVTMPFVRAGEVKRHLTRLPPLGPGEALLQVEACGVCGSDVSLFRGEKAGVGFPLVGGHEIVATVVQIDGAAQSRRRLHAGDRVVLEEPIPCHACGLCLDGRHRLCPNAQRYGGTSFGQGGELLGGYAEYVRLPAGGIAHPVSPDLDPVLATLFIPLSNGLSWLASRARLRPGESVVVIGPGQHGLACVVAARHLGAGRIVVAGRRSDQSRLEAARQLGATDTITAEDGGLVGQVLDVTDGAGADILIDATPLATSPIRDAVQAAALGGRIVLVGAKRTNLLDSLPTDRMLFRELSILGVNARESWSIPAALGLLAEQPERFAPMSGPVFELAELETALRVLAGEMGAPPVHVAIRPTDQ